MNIVHWASISTAPAKYLPLLLLFGMWGDSQIKVEWKEILYKNNVYLIFINFEAARPYTRVRYVMSNTNMVDVCVHHVSGTCSHVKKEFIRVCIYLVYNLHTSSHKGLYTRSIFTSPRMHGCFLLPFIFENSYPPLFAYESAPLTYMRKK